MGLWESCLDFGARCARCLPAETAHHLAMGVLRRTGGIGLGAAWPTEQELRGLTMELPGVGRLAHPIGLAAGFDKNSIALGALSRLAFAAIEVGTVTPQPQQGNPKPRLFRLADQRAIINRMGFNNDGMTVVEARLRRSLISERVRSLVGVNVGKNKATANEAALEDYLPALQRFAPNAAYLVVNISSPNTPGLRELATGAFIERLSQNIGELGVKVWVKLDPDLPRPVFQEVVAAVAEQGLGGLVLTNTHRVDAPEAGGLSGHPLSVAAASRLEWAYEVHRGHLPMIASGGIFSGLDVLSRIARGASMVQIWSALVYRGPLVVRKILAELRQEMRLRGIEELDQVRNSYYDGNFA